MAEYMFYHLTHSTLEASLPILLEKSLERGWKAVIRSDNEAHIAALDGHLWSYDDASFLPHDTYQGTKAEQQPIYLTIADENPNAADVCFLIDGALPFDSPSFERYVYMFDGRNQDRLTAARALWKSLKDKGFPLTYWQQNQNGGWQKMAESKGE